MNTRHPLSVLVAVIAFGAAGAAQATIAANGTEVDGIAVERSAPRSAVLGRAGVVEGRSPDPSIDWRIIRNGTDLQGVDLKGLGLQSGQLRGLRIDRIQLSLPGAAR
ncbi:MAG: hypothetical protein U1E89_04190 [Burkholderiaceae bacterium]